MGQWLALRNLGLVPVASPETFQWPGRFLGLRRDTSTWAVFFGVPPGIVYDPLAEPDEEKQDAAMDAAFVLAEHDPRRGTEPGSGTESVGTVELIALAAEAEGPMRAVSAAEAVVSPERLEVLPCLQALRWRRVVVRDTELERDPRQTCDRL